MVVVPIRETDWSRSVVKTAPAPEASAFGRLLRELRIAAGLSQNEVAHRAAVNAAYVNRFERSPKLPNQPSRAVVVGLWLAVNGERDDLDRLLAAAGLLPESIADAGGWDAYLRLQRGEVSVLEAQVRLRDQHIAAQSRRFLARIQELEG